MTRYVGYIATSLDGFIADPDGGVSWLDQFNDKMEGDGGYGDFIAGIDALISGRSTHDQVLGWGWPYGDLPNYVLTGNPDYTADHVAAAGNIDTIKAEIEKAGHKCVWVLGGGKAQRTALDAGMFDTLKVFVMPIVLGGGAPLFAPGKTHNLTLESTKQHGGGIMELNYTIKD